MNQVKLSSAASSIVAKTDSAGSGWLPLNFHLLDTAAVAGRLLNNWLPPAARRAMAPNLDDETLYRVVMFLSLAHDFGKATPAFQEKVVRFVPGAKERLASEGMHIPAMPSAGKSPHAIAGETLLLEASVPASLAAIVGAHHGKPADDAVDPVTDQLATLRSNYRGRGKDETWQQVQREYLCWALNLSGFASSEELPALSVPSQILLTGLLIMADWIASCTDYFPLIPFGGPVTEYDVSRIDAAWERLCLIPAWTPEEFPGIEGLCAERFGFEPNALQQAAMDIASKAADPGILIVEAQMGIGKTEAALLAAEIMSDGSNGKPKRGGVFFGLPTQATANGIFERLLDWGEKQAQYTPATIRLAHGAAELNEAYAGLMNSAGHPSCIDPDAPDDSCLIVHEWFRGRKQALLSDFVVGTVDQLLMVALKQRHVMLRHLGMCGKIAIIDECHAYDAYMNRYLESALRWLGACHVPVILLSATLPAERRAAFIDAYTNRSRRQVTDGEAWRTCRDYPLLTWTDSGIVSQRAIRSGAVSTAVSIERMPDTPDETMEMEALSARLASLLADGGCAGVVVNTVRRAQKFAQLLRERLPEFDVLLLHAQFVMPERIKREQELLRRVGKLSENRNRLIAVGTQVFEQSLDLDFDLLATDLCPMDLLLQRLGRLHRHHNHDAERPAALREARCLLMGTGEKPEEGSAAVYGEYLLMRTRSLLPETISLPSDIPELVRKTYDDALPLPQLPEGYDAAREKYQTGLRQQQNKANTFCLQLPQESRRRPNTIDGLLSAGLGTEEEGERSVRDGGPSIETLVLQRLDGSIRLLDGSRAHVFSSGHVPDEASCRLIARQKLRLPHALCTPWAAPGVIGALRAASAELSEWYQSSWLRGELFLVLDENGTAKLDQWTLQYDRELGLLYRKEESHARN